MSNMSPVELGNTKFATIYAQKIPWTLVVISWFIFMSFRYIPSILLNRSVVILKS